MLTRRINPSTSEIIAARCYDKNLLQGRATAAGTEARDQKITKTYNGELAYTCLCIITDLCGDF
jgi:hypothetical protein